MTRRTALQVIDGQPGRRGWCSRCAMALGVPGPLRTTFVWLAEPVDIGDERMEPGWYCRQCLRRAKR